MADKQNSVCDKIFKMKSAYNNSPSQTSNVTRGINLVRNSDYLMMYNDLNGIINLVNSYGSFDKTTIKFPIMTAYPGSVGTKVTASISGNYLESIVDRIISLLNS